MAFTVKSTPQEYQPAFNPIYFVVDSGNNGACSYKYIADLYINGSLAVRLFTYPEGSNSYGVFRIDRILQDYISYDLHANMAGFSSDPNSFATYYIEFREEFDNNSPCTGVTTISGILSTSSDYYAWNAAIQKNEFVLYNDIDYTTDSIAAKFLTSAPDNVLIGIDDQFNLSFLQTLTTVSFIQIKTYDIAGSLMGTYRIANAQLQKHVSVGAGPYNLNNSTLTLGAQPVIISTVSYYDVSLWVIGSPTTYPVSETKRFKLDYSCTVFETKRLWWLNRSGGFDAYSFKLKSFRKVDISRNEYSKLLGSLVATRYEYAVHDRGRTNASVAAKDNLIYNTNWLTEPEGIWLEELFTSLEVYEKAPNQELTIVGCSYNAFTVNMTLDSDVRLPIGTTFTYVVTNGAAIGMANSGSGTITGFLGSGVHTTNVACTTNVVADIPGTMTVLGDLTPMIVKSNSFDEKLKNNSKKIQYKIEINPAHDINIQKQ